MENKITKLEKKIIFIEAVFVFVSFAYVFFSSAPHQVYPLNGMTISENNFNIEIQNGEQVLISSNEDFENPIVLGKDSQVTLNPGIYFWKVKSKFRESEVYNFTIQSQVGLNIKQRDKGYELQNSGNVDLNVTKKNAGITGSIVLDKGESKNVAKDNSSYIGGEK